MIRAGWPEGCASGTTELARPHAYRGLLPKHTYTLMYARNWHSIGKGSCIVDHLHQTPPH